MLNDELISAYLDGELDQDKRALVEHWLASDNGAAARLERIRNADSLIRRAIPTIATSADDPIAAMIMGTPPVNVVVFKRPWVRRAAAIAAACVMGLLVGRFSAPNFVSLERAAGQQMYVSAELARVLDVTPSGATAPVMGGEVQMALSVQTESGVVCREFRTVAGARSVDAVACNEGGGWRMIVQAAVPRESGRYTTAGADASPTEAAINALGGAIVLDAREEEALIRAGWRTHR
jgi:hypothetical protein